LLPSLGLPLSTAADETLGVNKVSIIFYDFRISSVLIVILFCVRAVGFYKLKILFFSICFNRYEGLLVFEPIFRYLEEALDRHADTLLGELVNIDFYERLFAGFLKLYLLLNLVTRHYKFFSY
jgi:hypothetical protein